MKKQKPDMITGSIKLAFYPVIPSKVFFVFLCFFTLAAGQNLPTGVEIKIHAQPQQATVGDPIQINLDITFPDGYQANVINPGHQVGAFEILEFLPGPLIPDPDAPRKSQVPPPSKGPDGTPLRHRARVVAAAYRTGEFEFAPLRVVLRTPDGKDLEVSSPPVKILIESVLAAQDQDLKGLKKQAEIREPARWILWLAVGLLASFLTAIAWWLWQRRRRPSSPLPLRPHVDPLLLAEAELRDLIGRGLLERGLVKSFYVALSEIMKRALEAGYGISTLERTTSEIMKGLRGSSAAPPPETLDQIELLLLGSDMVKFAKYLPPAGENDQAIKRAFQILDGCKRLKAQAAAGLATVVEAT